MDVQINTPKAVTKKGFQAGYDMLLPSYQKEIRGKIMFECEWFSASTFINKRKGIQYIRKPEILIIEKIFAEYNLDPWTGKHLK